MNRTGQIWDQREISFVLDMSDASICLDADRAVKLGFSELGSPGEFFRGLGIEKAWDDFVSFVHRGTSSTFLGGYHHRDGDVSVRIGAGVRPHVWHGRLWLEPADIPVRARQSDVAIHAPVALWKADTSGRVTFVNDAVRDLLGLAEDFMLPTSFRNVFRLHDTDLGEWSRFLADRGGPAIWSCESVLEPHDPDSEPFDVVVMVRRIASDNGNEYIGYLGDLRAFRALEREIEHAGRLRAIGQLAGGVAHDLNNMLAPILGFASLLRDRQHPDEEIAEGLETIEQAARRASELTRQLLAFGRKEDASLVSISARDVVDDVVRLLKRTIEKEITLEVLQTTTDDVLYGDASQLQHALLNIALNARDAISRNGTLTFEISGREIGPDDNAGWQHAPAAGRYVIIAVEDDGAGVSPEVMSRMFEPFFTTKGDAGSGLGLPAVESAVAYHGGGLRVESTVGLGTRFEIALPLRPKRLDTTAEFPSMSADAVVWAIDADESILNVYRRVLSAAGFEVHVFSNASDVLEQLALSRPATLLVDVDAHALGGRDLVREIDIRAPLISVVIVTGRRAELDLGDRSKHVHLRKPFDSAELVSAVERSLL